MKIQRKFVGNESLRIKNKRNKVITIISLIIKVNNNQGFFRELIVSSSDFIYFTYNQ